MNYSLRLTAITTTAAIFVHCCTCTDAFAGDPCAPYWDATIGQPGMGGNNPSIVTALTIYNEDLIAGGYFTTAGGQEVNYIARWDGLTWHPLIATDGTVGIGTKEACCVRSLAVYNDELIVGGFLNSIGDVPATAIARWNGADWNAFDPGIWNLSSFVDAFAIYNGDLIAGGDFTTVGGVVMNRIARWDGSAWHPLISGGQNGVSGDVTALTVFNGELIVGGYFLSAGGQQVNRIARWDGSAWHPLSSGGSAGVDGANAVFALTVFNGELIAGGDFTTAGGQQVRNIARWDGTAWHPISSDGQVGVNHTVYALTEFKGDLMVGGIFFTAGVQAISRIARWDGTSWHALAPNSELGDEDSSVNSLCVYNDSLVVGGIFLSAGKQATNQIVTLHAPQPVAPGDLDCDGVVNVADLFQLLAAWGPCGDCTPEGCPADITNSAGTCPDCEVNVYDLFRLLANWTP